MKIILAGFLLATWLCVTSALPKNVNITPNVTTKGVVNIVSQMTYIITDSLLKNSVDSYGNDVFSPVAFAAILALINEGAHGQTAQEFYDVFKLPNDQAAVRNAFDRALLRLNEDGSSQRFEYDSSIILSEGPIQPDFLDSLVRNYYTGVIEQNKYNGFNNYKPNVTFSLPTRGSDESIFCDKNVFGRSNIIGGKNGFGFGHLNAKSHLAEPFRQMINMQRSYPSVDQEIASALTGNAFSEPGNENDGGLDWFNMFLFQGTSFRASWATPFQVLPERGTFFINGTEKRVQMIRSSGKYPLGVSQKLDAKFVELPYDNNRYTLLVMVPNKKDGFRDVIKNFNSTSLSSLQEDLTQTQVQVSMPKVYASYHMDPTKAFKKLGITSMYTKEADLNGIMVNRKIYIDDFEQSLTLRFTEGQSSSRDDTDSGNTVVETIDEQVEQFSVDRPFLYFLRDTVDNVVLYAGKITDALEVDDDQQSSGVVTGIVEELVPELEPELKPDMKESELEPHMKEPELEPPMKEPELKTNFSYLKPTH